jgi:hypothetical protein
MDGYIISLGTVFGLLAAAGEVDEAATSQWPHHAAIRELVDKTPASSDLCRALRDITFRPSADVGLMAPDVARTFRGLLKTGAFLPGGTKPVRTLMIDPAWRARHRELLNVLDRADRRLLRQTGRRWAAYCRTASNSPASGLVSSS